ncbi:MAG TPA: TetR/AcrR family transcriptional regulator [Candidatus Dormibacteraeota bacterium]|nr:TetR/AcrR family transcriptional regulator [Candidatus Dormibacteraeota bacterium]
MKQAEELEAPSTRERILAAALDLFTEQGFDKTSLREVSERVGVTKAALYYHFRSKEEMLSSLVERAHGIGHHGFDVLPLFNGPIDFAAALGTFSALLDQVLSNRKIFVLMERNRTAIEGLGDHDPAHQEEHRQLERQWAEFVANPKISLRDRVRVSAALGAVMAGAVGTTRGLGTDAPEGLKDELLSVLRDLFGLAQPA